MPITVRPAAQGPRFSGRGGGEVPYIVGVTDDEFAAKTALDAYCLANAPTLWNAVYNDGEITGQSASPGTWDARAIYVIPEWQKFRTGGGIWSIDTTGGTQHVSQSKQTVGAAYHVAYYDSAPDFGGAINVEQDGGTTRVNGVDIGVPLFKLSITRYIASASVTADYLLNLYRVTNTWNTSAITLIDPIFGTELTFERGELLYAGSRQTPRESENDWEITFDLVGSPNSDDATSQLGLTAVAKMGWDYLWVLRKEIASIVVPGFGTFGPSGGIVPVAAYVERIIGESDFSLLRLNG